MPSDLTIAAAHELLKNKQISATELTKQYLDRIAAVDPKVEAYLTVTAEQALAHAKKIDEAGDFSNPLTGIPMGMKDALCTKGIRTTAASKMLENFVPPYDATVVEKLEKVGSVMIGKVNHDEFMMGSSTENSAFKTTKNPWDLTRVPGGTSGGSAAAVIADEAIFSIGTDTGGSIRQPAAFCGCVGLKPTYGRVSRYGVIPYASSFDTIGPVTKTVEDAAIVLSAIAGTDPKDSTTPAKPVPNYQAALQASIKGKKIGLPKEFFPSELNSTIAESVKNAAKELEKLGCEIVEISLPLTKYAIPAYYILAKAEASANLARYDGIRFGHVTDKFADLTEMYKKSRAEGFGPEVKRAIMMGTYVLSAGYYDAFYLKAAKVRTLIIEEYRKAFESVDAILTPVTPSQPFQIGVHSDDPIAMYLEDVFTVPINLAGIPGLSLPVGFANGLPIGAQLLGPQFGEEIILNIGWHLEQAIGFRGKYQNSL